MFSAVNAGHCHRHIKRAVIEQLNKGMIGRVWKSASSHLADLRCYQSYIGKSIILHFHVWPFARRLCTLFDYDKVVAMTSGTEAADTACKIARCWGINQKQIPAKDCVVLGVGDCYQRARFGDLGLGKSMHLRAQSR